MGDLLANTTKNTFEDSMHDPSPAIEELRMTCGRNLQRIAAWDESYFHQE